MGSSTLVQRSFTGGAIAPSLFARVDHVKRQSGLKTCVNWFVERFGSVANRAGTLYIGQTKGAGGGQARLIKFVRDSSNAYVLEFGHHYMRVYKNDAPVAPSASAWLIGTAYIQGDLASYSGTTYYCIADGVGHQPDVSPTFWYAMPTGMIELPAVYADVDLAALQFVQSVDVLTITHPSYAVVELKRYSDTRWVFSTPVFGPGILPPAGTPVVSGRISHVAKPTGVTAVGGNAALPTDFYLVANFSYANPGFVLSDAAGSTVGGADAGNPVVLNWTPGAGGTEIHYLVYRYNVATSLYQTIGAVTTATTLTDNGLAFGTGAPTTFFITEFAYVVTAVDANGLESVASSLAHGFAITPTATNPNTITWAASTGAVSYNVYNKNFGVLGFVGSTTNLSFSDPGITPDVSVQPPSAPPVFASSSNYPSTVSYFQQRQCFGNSITEPEKFWLSRTGNFHDFSESHPIGNDDAVIGQLNGEKINSVRFMMDLGNLVLFTDNGVYGIDGDADGVVTPKAINARRQTAIGSSATLRPLVVNNSALYVQAIGNVVRDLRFDLQSNGYTGDEVSLWGSHLLDGHTITAWDYAEIPHSVVWAARDDGKLLGLTYVPRETIAGWHLHDVGGIVEDVCVIPGSLENTVYFVVNRLINGSTVRYIEKLASRHIVDPVADPHFVDCGVHAMPVLPAAGSSLSLTGGVTWKAGEVFVLRSSANLFGAFTAYHTGVTVILGFGSVFIRALIIATGPVSPQNHIGAQLLDDVPTAYRSVATFTWSTTDAALLTSVNMSHLIGQTVVGLADGNVIGPYVVPGGGTVNLGLDQAATHVHLGLPITADLETLDIETGRPGETLVMRTRTIQKVVVTVDDERGITVGEDFASMEEPPERSTTDAYDAPVALFNGPRDVYPRNSWGRGGNVCIRQSQPLPARVLAVAVNVTLGDA